jgi:iron complex transport system substrate-binding protein
MLPTTDAIIKSIEDAGIPVIITPGFTDATSLKDGLRFIAKVLGPDEEKVAEEFCTYYDRNLEMISPVTSGIPKDQRFKLYYSANNPLNTEGQGTLPQFWAETAGAVNVAAEAGIVGSFKDINIEDVIKWDPDIIVCRDFANVGAIMTDTRFADISAVKNQRVYVNPKGIFVWCVRSAEEALQILWAAKTLYPEKFPDLDVRKETRDFYEKFYNYILTEEDLNETLSPTS